MNFHGAVLSWFDTHGRHNLPWQKRGDYCTWISEIMLQQTQVATVIPYFEAFMARFPSIQELAAAELDDVLAHWSGLGYYARARNLHKTARLCPDGLPRTLDELIALPGIGRSTAGAILSMGQGQRGVILDGNVKRVLARYSAEPEWPGTTAAQNRLWSLAESVTPAARSGDFAQAMMDLGSLVCTKRAPNCTDCPLNPTCASHNQGLTSLIPHPKPKKETPKKTRWWLVLQDPKGRVYLERRPESGLWGGLYCLPEADSPEELADAAAALTGLSVENLGFSELAPIKHTFSHYQLTAKPLLIRAESGFTTADRPSVWAWPESELGTPAPVTALLKSLMDAPNDLFGETL